MKGRTTSGARSETVPPEDSDRARDYRLELSITGLSCAGDAAPLTARLSRVQGVRDAMLNPITERAVIAFDPGTPAVADVIGLFSEIGLDTADRPARLHVPAPGCVCEGCAALLEDRLSRLAGVAGVELNRDRATVSIDYVPSSSDHDLIDRVLTTPDASSCTAATSE